MKCYANDKNLENNINCTLWDRRATTDLKQRLLEKKALSQYLAFHWASLYNTDFHRIESPLHTHTHTFQSELATACPALQEGM